MTENTTQTKPTNKAELLQLVQASFASFEALLATLTEEQLTTPGVNDDWSAKDAQVHITAWQKRVIIRLLAFAKGKEPQLESVTNEEEMHAFTARIYEANRDEPWATVHADARAIFARLLTAIQAMSEDDLFRGDRFAWTQGDPLWENIAGNTFEHYPEHTEQITAWVAMQAK
jgi:hypothetical protein